MLIDQLPELQHTFCLNKALCKATLKKTTRLCTSDHQCKNNEVEMISHLTSLVVSQHWRSTDIVGDDIILVHHQR